MMKEIPKNVFYEVLSQLFEEWASSETSAEIRSDPRKVELMKTVRDVLNDQGANPPKHIVTFYSGVFLCEQFGRS